MIRDQQSSNLDGNKSMKEKDKDKDKDKDKNILNDTLPLTLTKSGIAGSVSSKASPMNINSFSVLNGSQQGYVQSNVQSNVESNAQGNVQGNRGVGLTSAGGVGTGTNNGSSSSSGGRLSSSSRSKRISGGSSQPMVLSQTGQVSEKFSVR